MFNLKTWSLIFFEQRLDELERSVPINEWTSNMDKNDDKKVAKEKTNHQKKINSYFIRDHWPESIKK